MAKIIGTLGKYDKFICIVNPFDLFFFFLIWKI